MVGHCDFKHAGTILFHPPNMRPAVPVCQFVALPACFRLLLAGKRIEEPLGSADENGLPAETEIRELSGRKFR
jgi:hypothetical protein